MRRTDEAKQRRGNATRSKDEARQRLGGASQGKAKTKRSNGGGEGGGGEELDMEVFKKIETITRSNNWTPARDCMPIVIPQDSQVTTVTSQNVLETRAKSAEAEAAEAAEVKAETSGCEGRKGYKNDSR